MTKTHVTNNHSHRNHEGWLIESAMATRNVASGAKKNRIALVRSDMSADEDVEPGWMIPCWASGWAGPPWVIPRRHHPFVFLNAIGH